MTKSSHFAQNLACFARFCPEFVSAIENADCRHLEFCRTAQGELNLKRTFGGQTVYYHSQEGALNEAHEWVNKIQPLGLKVLCVFGIGLGYCYEALKKWLHKDPGNFLVLIEDDPAVVSRFLETEQASALFKDTQIVFQYFKTPGERDWGNFRLAFHWFYAFPKAQTRIFPSRFYLQIKPDECKLIQFQLEHNLSLAIPNIEEATYYQEFLSRNFYFNLPCFADHGCVETLYKKFKGVPALISGAGPSLSKHLPLLRELQDRALLIGCGTAFNVLTRNGIFPHMGFCIDPYQVQESRAMSHFGYEVPFCYSMRYYYPALAFAHGPLVHLHYESSEQIPWIFRQLGLEHYQYGSVTSSTNAGVCLAEALGCNPIVLVGTDLAFTDQSRYAAGAAGHPSDNLKVQNELTYTGTPTDTLQSTGYDGSIVNTNWPMVIEAGDYTDFSLKHPEISFINATEGGLKIQDVPNLPLQEVIAKKFKRTYDLHNWVHAEIQMSSTSRIPAEKILKTMEDWLGSLDRSYGLLQQKMNTLDLILSEVKQGKELGNRLMEDPFPSILSQLEKEPVYETFGKKYHWFYKWLFGAEIKKTTYFPDQYTDRQKQLIRLEMEIGNTAFLKDLIEIHQRNLRDAAASFRTQINKKADLPPPPAVAMQIASEYEWSGNRLAIRDEELKIDLEDVMDSSLLAKNEVLSQTVKGLSYYLNGELHGPSEFFANDGTLLAKTWFFKGKREGKSRQYYAGGALYNLERYRNGLLEGKQEYFYPSGVKKSVLSFTQGLLDGEVILYHPSGKVKRMQTFKLGKLHGKEEYWTEDGVKLVEAEYANNLPSGTTRSWHPNGKLAKEIVFYNDPRNFDMSLWDENGKLIHKQTSFPNDVFEDVKKKSEELQKSLQETTALLAKLKQKLE